MRDDVVLALFVSPRADLHPASFALVVSAAALVAPLAQLNRFEVELAHDRHLLAMGTKSLDRRVDRGSALLIR